MTASYDPLAGLSLLMYPSKRRSALTPLNHETTARYNACIANGGHVYRGATTKRTPPKGGEEVQMAVCDVCGVPNPGKTWMQSWTIKGPSHDEDEAA